MIPIPCFHDSDRYPNHEASHRIDQEFKNEIEQLRGQDGDFFHGYNSGVLAAARLFRKQADILHINDIVSTLKEVEPPPTSFSP
jgi:hypothetical protein